MTGGKVAEPPIDDELTDAARDRLAHLLNGEHVRLTGQLAGLVQTIDELAAPLQLEPADDEHDPDGTTAYERAQVTSLARESTVRLDQVAAAFEQLRLGTYGRCERCGEPIPEARLEAVLGTTRCVRCADVA